MVTNPVDTLTQIATNMVEKTNNKIIGQAGVLDSIRMATFISEKLNCSIKDVNAIVIGGHGDRMVPLIRHTNVSGVPINKLMDREEIEALIERTRKGGGEVLGLKQKSSAYNAPGAAVCEMVEAIIYNKKRILPCITMLNGEYGFSNIAIGVPVELNSNGVDKIIEFDLNEGEKVALSKSVKASNELFKEAERLIRKTV